MAEEEKYFERLKPCIHFLMDVIIHEDNCCQNQYDYFSDSEVDLLEVFTTMEILFCMGDEEAHF